ncbi:MAG TPA: response regulator [Thermoanaerobaculia bacterium]|jgi:DNA-binding NtrC family response regulator
MPYLNAEAPRRSILLIDDDELVAGSLRDHLLSKGWAVDVALEPDAAAGYLSGGQYGVVVIDPYMTGGVHAAGTSLLADIRASQPQSSIIVLTGYGSHDLARSASADPSTMLLSKPQSVTDLSALIQRIPSTSLERSL